MSRDVKAGAAFTPESVADNLVEKAGRRPMTGVEAMTIAALTISTVVAATAVSMGIARADILDRMPDHHTPMALMMVVGVVLAAMVGLTALAGRKRSMRR